MLPTNGWYVGINGTPNGPYSLAQVVEAIGAGHLTPDMLVWVEGMAAWMPAGELPQLFPVKPPPLPLIPPPVPARQMPSTSASLPEATQDGAPSHRTEANRAPSDNLPTMSSNDTLTPRTPQRSRRKWISKPTNTAEALDSIRGGAASGYVFAGMYVLGGLLTYFAGRDLYSNQPVSDAMATFIGFLGIAAIISGLSYWFSKKHHIAIPALLASWFAAEAIFKLASQTRPHFGWLFFYFFIMVGFFSGFRGTMFLRRAQNERLVNIKSQRAAESALPIDSVPQMALPAQRGIADAARGASSEVTASAPKKSNVIARHWRGELRLPVSYWVVGLLLNVVLYIAFTAAGKIIGSSDIGPAGAGAWILALMLVVLLVTAWQVVGIWRSAGRHMHITGRRLWGVLARVAVIFGLIQLGAQTTTLGPMLSHSLQLALGKDETPHYELRLLRAGTEVELSGGLSAGTVDALRAILDATPAIRVVHLNSIGGLLTEGFKLNRLFRERSLATYTSARCVSACTIAFLGGSYRYLSPGGSLGFHSASFGTLGGDSLPEINEEIVAALRRQGASDAFIRKATSTPPTSMWYPKHEELLAAGVVTRIVDANQLGISGVGSAWKNPSEVHANLEAALQTNPLFAILREREPKYFDKMLAAMVQGVTQGRSVVEVQADIAKTVMSEMLPKYLRAGSARELAAYWRVQIDELRYLAEWKPDACVGFLFPELRPPTWDMTRILSRELQARDLAALTALMRADLNVIASSPSPSDEEWASVVAGAESAMPGSSTVIQNPKDYVGEPLRLCKAFIAFYSKILELPSDKAVTMLRSVVQ